MSIKPSGEVNIYFSGSGSPGDPGHGHYAMDKHGMVTYRRDPFDPHGAHNYEDDETDESQYGANGTFEGFPALIETGFTKEGLPKVDIYYGGEGGPLGLGHGHVVKLRDGDSVVFWRNPMSSGGDIVIDNRSGIIT